MIVKSYVATGFIWEVYDGDSGNGLNNHPFTGWSALIVSIMAELY
jgi:mannosyl-oligosaccharide glucosidase